MVLMQGPKERWYAIPDFFSNRLGCVQSDGMPRHAEASLSASMPISRRYGGRDGGKSARDLKILFEIKHLKRLSGGKGGIRTHGTLASTSVFETVNPLICPLNDLQRGTIPQIRLAICYPKQTTTACWHYPAMRQAHVVAGSARQLHSFLEVGKDFSNWVKDRIDAFGFVEGQDFVIVEGLSTPNLVSAKSRPQTTKEYYLTIDMAKELSMVERNEKGKQARRYFIECERCMVKATLPHGLHRLRAMPDVR